MNNRGRNTSSRLRQRLTLQQEVRTLDDGGGYVRSWQNIADLWAEIVPVTGRETLSYGQIIGEVTHRITLRYRDGITAANRLVFESRIFNIRSVFNVREENELVEIFAAEGAAS